MSFSHHQHATKLPLLFALICFTLCSHADVVVVTNALRQDSIPAQILIINSFDASAIKARKDKRELFAQLADSLQQILYQKIDPPFNAEPEIYPDILRDNGDLDSAVRNLMHGKAAPIAIVIRQLDVSFNKTDVETTGNNKEGKSTEVSYDICAEVTYALYAEGKENTTLPVKICEPFTTRPSFSGFITFGPDIVGKRKYAFKIIATNATNFLSSSSLFDFWEKFKQ